MATAQLNVRIDANLKASGDAVLERNGVSAVQIIRATWQYLADHQRLPDYVKPGEKWSGDAEPSPESCAAGMALRLAQEAGLRADLESMSFGELRETAYEEMLIEEAERRA